MLQIGKTGISAPEENELAALARYFSNKGYVHLRNLLASDLCGDLVSTFHKATYVERLTENIGCVEVCQAQQQVNMLNTMASQQQVVQAINKIYQGPPVEFFMGNVVRRIPGKNHFSNYQSICS